MNHRPIGKHIIWVTGFLLLLSCTERVPALDTKTEPPFLYIIDYTPDQHRDSEFRKKFDSFVPDLYHPGPNLRYLKGFGGCENPMDLSFDAYKEQVQDYLDYLHDKGVKWITPYLCNQSITGHYRDRTGAWKVYDQWEKYRFLGLEPQPPDPIEWMQREPSGNLHYNYKRMCFLGRGMSADLIRYAPCPNNPHWRRFCNNEARLGAELGFDGFFIDNCIIHCYCAACENRFQAYLKEKYSPEESQRAFGTENYSEIRLYKEGDLRYWARTFPGFIPYLEEKYPPEERRIPFDTTGPLDPVHVDNAGGGMLIGETHEFVAEKILRPGTQPTFENTRLANPALQDRIGRLRWAETMMFWGDSIGDMLAEMRSAGQKVNPGFFLMPNWGTMLRVRAAVGRAEDGHDMRRWKTGGDWQMYEEGYTTGMIAPGLLVEYDMQLRYAFANDIRAMLLPYKLEGEDVEEVALAETAASGGSVLVDLFNYPEIQKTYRDFYQSHPDFYEGYRSTAKVALAYFFDQTYFLNIEHFRQVHALNRYLADQQISFDILVEDDLQRDNLGRYDVVILPHITHLNDGEMEAIQSFLENGNTIIVIGECGTFDRRCFRREQQIIDEYFNTTGGHVVCLDTLSEALPHPGIFLEPGIQSAESFDDLGEDASNKYKNLSMIDEKLWFKRYQYPGPITAIIEQALGESPSLLEPWDASGVRFRVYDRETDEGRRMVVHLVNKNVPLAVPVEERRLMPVRNLRLRLPLRQRSEIDKVRRFAPGEKDRSLAWEEQDGVSSVVFDLPGAYALIVVDYRVL